MDQNAVPVTVDSIGAGALTQIQDIWCRHPTHEEILAYKALRDAEQITDIKITYSRATGITIFTYWSTLPKEWIHDALRTARKEFAGAASEDNEEV